VMGAKPIMLKQLHHDTGMIGVQPTGCARYDHRRLAQFQSRSAEMDFAIPPDQDLASLWLRNISLVDVSEKGGSGVERVGGRVTSLASNPLVEDLLNAFFSFFLFLFFFLLDLPYEYLCTVNYGTAA